MSFGWSAGDIAVALKLLFNLVEALDSADGASRNYREAVGFLKDLTRTLTPLEKLKDYNAYPSYASDISGQLQHIKKPIEDFLSSILKYEPSLGATAPQGRHRQICRKLQWYLWKENKVIALRDTIESHIQIIDILMQRLILDVVLMTQDKLPETLNAAVAEVLRPELLSHLRDSLVPLRGDIIRSLGSQKEYHDSIVAKVSERDEWLLSDIQVIKAHLENNAIVQQRIESCLILTSADPKLHTVRDSTLEGREPSGMNSISSQYMRLTGSRKTKGRVDNMGQVFAETPTGEQNSDGYHRTSLRDVYTLVLLFMGHFLKNIFLVLSRFPKPPRTLMPVLPARENISFLDAIGSPLRILPYEYFRSLKVLRAFIEEEFKNLPGSTWVDQGRYQLLSTIYNRRLAEDNWSRIVSPGTAITMAMVIRKGATPEIDANISKCPAKSCSGHWKRPENTCWVRCPICQKEVLASTITDNYSVQHQKETDRESSSNSDSLSNNAKPSPNTVARDHDADKSYLKSGHRENASFLDDIDIEAFRRVLEIPTTSLPVQHIAPGLDEEACRKMLTSYEAISIEKFSQLDPPKEKLNWSKAEHTRESVSQTEIAKEIMRLDANGPSVVEKTQELGSFQLRQINIVMDGLKQAEGNRDYEWSLAQIDRHFRALSKGRKETTTISVYAKRSLRTDLSALVVYQHQQRMKQERMDRAARPPPPEIDVRVQTGSGNSSSDEAGSVASNWNCCSRPWEPGEEETLWEYARQMTPLPYHSMWTKVRHTGRFAAELPDLIDI